MTVRAFLAHSKGDDEMRVSQLRDDIRSALERISAGRRAVEVVTGRDFYLTDFSRLGSWEAFAREVAGGIHYLTREPLFSVIVVPDERIGAATQSIVKCALGIAKPVVRWHAGDFVKVNGVVQVSRDMKNGWLVQSEAG